VVTGAVTYIGFTNLFRLLLARHQLRVIWRILTRFGYTRNCILRHDYITWYHHGLSFRRSIHRVTNACQCLHIVMI
jgi:hypothetical protein